jgi:hypothetical protein
MRELRIGELAAARLTYIPRCREFDFSISQVRALVAISHDPNRSCRASSRRARVPAREDQRRRV